MVVPAGFLRRFLPPREPRRRRLRGVPSGFSAGVGLDAPLAAPVSPAASALGAAASASVKAGDGTVSALAARVAAMRAR